MGRPATAIVLTPEDRATLTQRLRAPTSEQCVVVRAHIVLAAADGQSTDGIAEQLALRPATVSKWRHRFATQGVAGLADAPRPGPSRRYDAASERRILKQLDAPPWHSLASSPILVHQHRPGICAQGRRHRRLVSRAARQRGRDLGRRETAHLSPGTRPRLPAVAERHGAARLQS